MRILPVLDLKGAAVVHAIAGRRETYAPIRSRVAESSEPLAVARALRRAFGFERLYIADLDAIAGAPPSWRALSALLDDGFHLLVDAGLRDAGGARALVEAGVHEVVAALETLPSPAVLARIAERVARERLVFGLDARCGVPLGDPRAWPRDARAVLGAAASAGVRRVLYLDLERVGTSRGPAFVDLAEELRSARPELAFLTGGGVRGPADLEALEASGVEEALVSSALHDGSLRPGDLARWR